MADHIKLHFTILKDPTVGRLDDWHFRLYYELYLISSNSEGYLPDLVTAAWLLRKTKDDLRQGIDHLESIGLLRKAGGTWKIARFDVEQKPENDWKEFQSEVFERDGACVYCGGKAEHLDHIRPRSKGGKSTLDNLAASCARCNHSKNNQDLKAWYYNQSFFDYDRWSYILKIMDGKAK